jgi:hypothetical protein
VKQKTPANVRTANVNVHVAKAENIHAKENAHAAADAKNNKKKLTTNTLRDTNY